MAKNLIISFAGYFGYGNLGDELILESEINLFSDCLRDKGLSFTANIFVPLDKGFSYGYQNRFLNDVLVEVRLINRWSIFDIIRTLGKTDLFILGGGSLFQDVTSIRSPFYYSFLSYVAKILTRKIWMFGQGVGPLKRRISRFITAKAFKMADKIFLRDERSISFIKEILGINSNNIVLIPDVVFYMLKYTKNLNDVDKEYIVLNLRPIKHRQDVLFKTAVQTALRFSKLLKMPVLFVGMHKEDIIVFNELKDKGVFYDIEIREVKIESFDEAMQIFSKAVLTVGMRFHSLVLSACFGVPFIGVPYDPKVESICDYYGAPLSTQKDLLIEEILSLTSRIKERSLGLVFELKRHVNEAIDEFLNEVV